MIFFSDLHNHEKDIIQLMRQHTNQKAAEPLRHMCKRPVKRPKPAPATPEPEEESDSGDDGDEE